MKGSSFSPAICKRGGKRFFSCSVCGVLLAVLMSNIALEEFMPPIEAHASALVPAVSSMLAAGGAELAVQTAVDYCVGFLSRLGVVTEYLTRSDYLPFLCNMFNAEQQIQIMQSETPNLLQCIDEATGLVFSDNVGNQFTLGDAIRYLSPANSFKVGNDTMVGLVQHALDSLPSGQEVNDFISTASEAVSTGVVTGIYATSEFFASLWDDICAFSEWCCSDDGIAGGFNAIFSLPETVSIESHGEPFADYLSTAPNPRFIPDIYYNAIQNGTFCPIFHCYTNDNSNPNYLFGVYSQRMSPTVVTSPWFAVSNLVKSHYQYVLYKPLSSSTVREISSSEADLFFRRNMYGNWADATGSNSYTLCFSDPFEGCDASFACNFPIFDTIQHALEYINTGVLEGCLNVYEPVLYPDEAAGLKDSALTAPVENLWLSPDEGVAVARAIAKADSLPEVHPLSLPVPSVSPGTDPGTDPSVQPGTNPQSGVIVVPDVGELVGDLNDDGVAQDNDDLDSDDQAYKTHFLRNLFPFCLPFDLADLFRALCADPEAPVFSIPLAFPDLAGGSYSFDNDYASVTTAGDGTYYIRLDLSFMNGVMSVFRLCMLVSFIILLIFATGKLIKW